MRQRESPQPDHFCPICGYSLTGLPAVHTCPECGYGYDPDATVVRFRSQRHDFHELVAGCLLIALFSWGWWSGGSSGVPVLLLLAVVFAMMSYLYRIYARIGAAHDLGCDHLVLDRSGVRFVHPSLPNETIAWEAVGRGKYRWWSGIFVLVDTNGRVILRCDWRDLGSQRTARKAAREINRLKGVYWPMKRSGTF